MLKRTGSGRGGVRISGTPSTAKARGLEFTLMREQRVGVGQGEGGRSWGADLRESGLGVPYVTFCKAIVIKSR